MPVVLHRPPRQQVPELAKILLYISSVQPSLGAGPFVRQSTMVSISASEVSGARAGAPSCALIRQVPSLSAVLTCAFASLAGLTLQATLELNPVNVVDRNGEGSHGYSS